MHKAVHKLTDTVKQFRITGGSKLAIKEA